MSDSVYLLAEINVTDPDRYVVEYGLAGSNLLIKAGAEVLSVSQNPKVMEGESFGNLTVLVRFPNEKSLNSWYLSDEYTVLKKLRVDELSDGGNIIVLPSMN